MTPDLIVTRHPGAVEWIARKLGGHLCDDYRVAPAQYVQTADRMIPVLASVTAHDVRDEVVVGNLPLHLAALCREVWAIEFPERLVCRPCNGSGTTATVMEIQAMPPDEGHQLPSCPVCEGRGTIKAPGAPRGAEYTAADMDAAGARLACYVVEARS